MKELKILICPFLSFFSIIFLFCGVSLAAKQLEIYIKKNNFNGIFNNRKNEAGSNKIFHLFKNSNILTQIIVFAFSFLISLLLIKNFIVSLFFSIMFAFFANEIIKNIRYKKMI